MSKTYDLSTSSKWSSLADGDHTVQIVAKGTGYKDSEKSTAITFTKSSGAITDLTGYTWVGNDKLDNYTASEYVYVSFSNETTDYTSIHFQGDWTQKPALYNLAYGSTNVYSFLTNSWNDTAYKTIKITGGTDATNATLISWLQANGTLTPTSVTYKLSWNWENNVYMYVTVDDIEYDSIQSPYSLSKSCTITVFNANCGYVEINGTAYINTATINIANEDVSISCSSTPREEGAETITINFTME